MLKATLLELRPRASQLKELTRAAAVLSLYSEAPDHDAALEELESKLHESRGCVRGWRESVKGRGSGKLVVHGIAWIAKIRKLVIYDIAWSAKSAIA